VSNISQDGKFLFTIGKLPGRMDGISGNEPSAPAHEEHYFHVNDAMVSIIRIA
jgi:hypothetical protein